MPLTLARLRELLHYDPETGEFRWRTTRNGRALAGSIAGSINTKGYRNICIDRKWYGAHRLAWFWVHDRWPRDYIDHRNRDNSDNRLANLREATAAQNAHNRCGNRNTKSGIKGIYPRRNGSCWEAWIMREGDHLYLGQFTTPAEASAAYQAAARRLHGAFAIGG